MLQDVDVMEYVTWATEMIDKLKMVLLLFADAETYIFIYIQTL